MAFFRIFMLVFTRCLAIRKEIVVFIFDVAFTQNFHGFHIWCGCFLFLCSLSKFSMMSEYVCPVFVLSFIKSLTMLSFNSTLTFRIILSLLYLYPNLYK